MQISRGPSTATARQRLNPGPSSLGQVPEPPNFAGPLLNDMAAVRVQLVQLASDSQLQAHCDDDDCWRHLFLSGPFSFSVGIWRPSLLGFHSAAALHTVSWSSSNDTMQRSTAAPRSTVRHRTVQQRHDEATSAPPRISRIRISRLPRISRTKLRWRAGRQGGRAAVAVLQRRATIAQPSPAQPARAAAQW